MTRSKFRVTQRTRQLFVVGAAVLSIAVPARALDLSFSETAGFVAAPTATVVRLGGGAPVAGRGGLEFSNAVVVPPGPPLGSGTAPLNIWKGVAWGCQLFNASPSTCANAGVIGNGTGFSDAFSNPDRNSLSVEGKFGNLTDTTWTDITIVRHHNNIISDLSNVLRTVDIHSFLRVGPVGAIADTPAPGVTKISFTESPNNGVCNLSPAAGAPVNPLGSNCDDFAIVSSLDLAPVFIPVGTVGNTVAMFVDFRLSAAPGAGALVCDGSPEQPGNCGGYVGPTAIVYTAEGSDNQLSLQARLRPASAPIPLFVIGDRAPHLVGNTVNFWGAQWWTNNLMSGPVSSNVSSFKGYANKADEICGGKWENRPGNSSAPPATIPADIAVIVTDRVVKNGPIIGGSIKQILMVHHDGLYSPLAGIRGSGTVTGILCPVTGGSICGNGIISGAETCDDGNIGSGDGCSASCNVESGFSCNGSPSMCTAINTCGNGIISGAETCDDGNIGSGDGCSASCNVESGFSCNGSPSICTAINTCGNGIISGAETCDDGNTGSGDGCSASCNVESGFSCSGSPSICMAVNICGNGIVGGTESCDDGNVATGDGCSSLCTVETGFSCSGSPSVCSSINFCGNGIVGGTEMCDDGNLISGDGCDANCTLTGCGNGVLTGSESCDDGNLSLGDGCSAVCQVETGFSCTGMPSVCQSP
jgi:cysteine-rich repeat protein